MRLPELDCVAYLEQLKDQVLFTRREGISVQSKDCGIQERVHLLGLDKVDALGQIFGLCLQQIEQFLIELKKKYVSAHVL